MTPRLAKFYVALLAAFFLPLYAFGSQLLGPYLLGVLPIMIVLGIAAHLILTAWRDGSERRQQTGTGEHVYGFAGHELLAFSDDNGQIWIRARDVRKVLQLERSDRWMARAYPHGYREAHPKVKAYYVQPEVVRRHWAGSHRIEINRFLSWMDRELVFIQSRRASASQATLPGLPQPRSKPPGKIPTGIMGGMLRAVSSYVVAHWNGSHTLLQTLLLGGGIALLVILLIFALPRPSNAVAHYQTMGIIGIFQLAGPMAVVFWWGMGVWRSTLSWVQSERSRVFALFTTTFGMSMMLVALDMLVERDTQYSLADLVMIAADSDPRPEIKLEAGGTHLSLKGPLGFGTTSKVARMLKDHPNIEGIELHSPGGRADEGLALGKLIRARGLVTYVRHGCASACVTAFSGGRFREAANSARFGLHRSGFHWRKATDSWQPIDLRVREFMLGQGVDRGFVTKGMEPSIHELWEPVMTEVLASGLANRAWAQGGSG